MSALDGFSGALSAVQGQALTAGSLAASAFSGGILSGSADAASAAAKVLSAAKFSDSARTEAIRGAGLSLAESFSGGIRSGKGGAASAASEALAAAKFSNAAATASARAAGLSLAEGFAGGIRSGSGGVGAAVAALVSQVTATLRTLLGIHSPSRVAANFGDLFGEGFADGIRGADAQVRSAADGLAGAAVGGLEATLPREARTAAPIAEGEAAAEIPPLNITVPLSVDGMKLGEASIRGINAVTRSAGKLLLNI